MYCELTEPNTFALKEITTEQLKLIQEALAHLKEKRYHEPEKHAAERTELERMYARIEAGYFTPLSQITIKECDNYLLEKAALSHLSKRLNKTE